MTRPLALLALALLAACKQDTVRTDTVLVPEAVEVVRRELVPVDKRLTQDIPCAEREQETVRAIINEAEANKAACKAYRANVRGIRESHPEE